MRLIEGEFQQEIAQVFLESTTTLVFKVDCEGKLEYGNKALFSTLGFGEEELLNQEFLPFVFPGDQERVKEAVRDIEQGKSVKIDFKISVTFPVKGS